MSEHLNDHAPCKLWSNSAELCIFPCISLKSMCTTYQLHKSVWQTGGRNFKRFFLHLHHRKYVQISGMYKENVLPAHPKISGTYAKKVASQIDKGQEPLSLCFMLICINLMSIAN